LACFDLSEFAQALGIEIEQIEIHINKLSSSSLLEVIMSPLINVTQTKVGNDLTSDQERWLKINQYASLIEENLPGNAKVVFKYFILDGSILKKNLLGKLQQARA
jgi:hypothetical protein